MTKKEIVITGQDKNILRELAKQVRDIAAEKINSDRIMRSRDMHSLKPGRPLVWIDEIPWHEMDINGELVLRCETKEAQNMEVYFRRVLYRWKYLQADMVVEDAFYVPKSYTDSGMGISIKEQTLATNAANNIVSHHYEDQLDTEEKVEALTLPVLETHPEKDKERLEIAAGIYDGILPVKLRGYGFYHAP